MVHIDDVPYRKPFAEMTDADRVYPGDGDIPLDDHFQVLAEIGYEGPVSLELFSNDLWSQDPYQVAKIGFDKCRRWFNWQS